MVSQKNLKWNLIAVKSQNYCKQINDVNKNDMKH